jgi:hypothetical protein
LATNPDATILLVAPSNTAADTLVRRLLKHLNPQELFRLNAPNRTFAEVQGDLMPYCAVQGDQFGLPTFEELMNFKVVCCGCVDGSILVHARATNSELMRSEVDLIKSVHPRSRKTRQVSLHWTHLVVDEVGCCPLMSAIPLTCRPARLPSLSFLSPFRWSYPIACRTGSRRKILPSSFAVMYTSVSSHSLLNSIPNIDQ